MRKIIVGILLLFNALSGHSQETGHGFYFFAIGDMPYFPGDFERLDHLIDQLNSQKPAFTVHVGDIKKGGPGCSDEYFEKVKSYFGKFDHPFFYTPGDNEWTDCTDYDPNERLRKLREVFFADDQISQGTSFSVKPQSKYPGYEKYAENLMWKMDSLVFGTLHVVGSNNNLSAKDTTRMMEYNERNGANLFWMDRLFEEAAHPSNRGLIIMMQAAMVYSKTVHTGFTDTVDNLKEQTEKLGKPVLLIYGDAHKFMVDKPLKRENGRVMENFTAVQVFGERDMHAVKITVDLNNPRLFIIEQEIVEKNK